MAKLSLKEQRLSSAVKRANQRLREIEKQGAGGVAHHVTTRRATSASLGASDLYSRTKKGQVKFRTDITKLTAEQRKRLSQEVNQFLKAKTSTIKGIKALNEQIKKTFNKRYGYIDTDTYDNLFKKKLNTGENRAGETQYTNAFGLLVDAYGYDEAALILNKPQSVIEKIVVYYANLMEGEKNLPSYQTFSDLMEGVNTRNVRALKRNIGL